MLSARTPPLWSFCLKTLYRVPFYLDAKKHRESQASGRVWQGTRHSGRLINAREEPHGAGSVSLIVGAEQFVEMDFLQVNAAQKDPEPGQGS